MRDLVMKRTPKDFDIITSAHLSEVLLLNFLFYFHSLYFWLDKIYMFDKSGFIIGQ